MSSRFILPEILACQQEGKKSRLNRLQGIELEVLICLRRGQYQTDCEATNDVLLFFASFAGPVLRSERKFPRQWLVARGTLYCGLSTLASSLYFIRSCRILHILVPPTIKSGYASKEFQNGHSGFFILISYNVRSPWLKSETEQAAYLWSCGTYCKYLV